MDEGLRRGQMCRVLRAEEERRPPPRAQWDSVESDTESLAQERAFQQVGHRDQTRFTWRQKENAESSQRGDRGEGEESEYLHLYDSLEVAALNESEIRPFLLHTQRLGTKIEEKSRPLSDDAYSDLQYDPNWRASRASPGVPFEEPSEGGPVLKGGYRYVVDTSTNPVMTPHVVTNESDHLQPQDDQTTHRSPEERHQNPQEPSGQPCANRGGPVLKGGYRYVVDESTVPVVTPHVATNKSNHLHPQDDHTSFRSPEEHPQEPSGRSCADRGGLVIKGGYRYVVNTSVVTPHVATNESDHLYRLHLQDGQQTRLRSPEERHLNPEEMSGRSCANRGGPVLKGGYRYVVDTSVVTPHVATNKSDHFHPQDDQTTLRSPQERIPTSFGISTKNEKSFDDVGENTGRTSEQIKDIQTCYQKEVKHTQEEPVETQLKSTTLPMSPKVLSDKNQRPLIEDIVQHNILTLGRSAPKRGSYAKVHALKQETPHQKKVHETLENTASGGSQKGRSAPKSSSLQKTATVAEIIEGKKAQRKEHPNPSQQQQQQQPPAPRVEAEHPDSLSSQLVESGTTTTPTKPQPLPSTVHVSIHLNAPSHLLPLLRQMGQDAIINIPSIHDRTYGKSASECKQTNLGKSSHVSRKGRNAHRGLEQWQRTAELRWPPYERQDQRWSPSEGYTTQNLPRTLTSASSQVMGSYTVLPPIEKPLTGKGAEPSLGLGVNATLPIQRSSSDGYLVQMERQKQMRAKGAHRASCVKDYKQLKSDTESQGLGPDCTAAGKTKLKRQKLYSDAVRQQNKKLSRIPFPPTKDPNDYDKKVPRMKALEYVKTIAKPPVQSQLKRKQRSQSEDPPSLIKDLDVSQLATLELLRKRHEEEKQAVALFTKQHAA